MLDEKKIKVRYYVKIHGLLWRSSPRLKSGGFRANFILVNSARKWASRQQNMKWTAAIYGQRISPKTVNTITNRCLR